MGTPTPPDAEAPPSREEFVREVTDALRAAGLGDGAFDYEPLLGTLVHTSGIGLDVHSLYESMRGVLRGVRHPTLANVARAIVAQEQLPARWDEAKDRVLPEVRPRIQVVAEHSKRSPREDAAPRPTAEITEHLVFEVAFPVEGASLHIPTEAYAAWGVQPEEVFQAAAVNMERCSQEQWTTSKDMPGVYRSPWSDGYDAGRLMLPRLFGRVPLKGWPVAFAPTPSQLYFTGADDEEGLFHLARVGRQVLERDRHFLFLRTLRMGADGESWIDWIPPTDHPAYQPLRLLRLLDEKRDYEIQGQVQQKMVPANTQADPLPPLHVLQSAIADTIAIAVWSAGGARPLPQADVIVFERGGDVLGYADWGDVARALPDDLEAMPTYPRRYLAGDFPEDWKLEEIGLKTWEGPLP